MTFFTEALRQLRIRNQAEFYKDGGRHPFIYYIPADNGRGGRSAHARVDHTHEQTNPGGHFSDHGRRTISGFEAGHGKKAIVEAAQEWAGEKYGITEWAKDPFGGWGEKSFVEGRVEQLKEELKAKGIEIPKYHVIAAEKYDWSTRARSVHAVAAKSVAEALRILDVTRAEYNFRPGSFDKSNQPIYDLAVANPGKVFVQPEARGRWGEGEWTERDA